MNRMDVLSDRPMGYMDPRRTPYKSIVPLHEVIREALGCGKTSKKIPETYASLVRSFGSEFGILLDVPVSDIAIDFPRIAEAVNRVRRGDITIVPGYDGEFGHVSVFPK